MREVAVVDPELVLGFPDASILESVDGIESGSVLLSELDMILGWVARLSD